MVSLHRFSLLSMRNLRFYSHQRRPVQDKTAVIAAICVTLGVVLPFVPPAIESQKKRRVSNFDVEMHSTYC